MNSRASRIIADLGTRPLIDVLRAIQREEGCLTQESLRQLAADRLISLTRLYGIASSYPELCFRGISEHERRVSGAGSLPEPLASVAREGAPELRQGGPLTERYGQEPASLADYEQSGGMKALSRALREMEPEQVLSEIVLGELTQKGEDWQRSASAKEAPLVVANANPGDPLAHQDGALLARDPYSVLEGMFLSAAAIGAERGFIFLGPRAAWLEERLRAAAEEMRSSAEEMRSAADMEDSTRFAVEVLVGPESLVGSVDSVAAACIEGSRPVPAGVPESISQHGVWNRAALVDSVEVFASITATLASGIQVKNRLFQITGAVEKAGLYETDCCTQSINSLIGMAGAPRGSALLIGGLAGQFLSGQYLEWPMSAFQRSDSQRWRTIHVLEPGIDQFALAAQLAEYNGRYLCGYCIPCRIGSVRMAEMMAAERVDREVLEEVAITVEKAGLCAPGRGAAAMVMSAIENGLFCRLNDSF